MEDPILQLSHDSNVDEGCDLLEENTDGPPNLQNCVSQSDEPVDSGVSHTDTSASEENEVTSAPILSAVVAPEVDPDNALRSPPKLQPAVVIAKRKSEESNKTPFKPLSGSMKNTPASLSIIDAPSTKSTRSTRSSIDPTFAAKQRSFLNRVHNALSSTRLNDVSYESDQEAAPDIGEDESHDTSPNYTPGCDDPSTRRLSILVNGSNKRRREDSPLAKVKVSTVQVNSSHWSATDNESQEPIQKKRISEHGSCGKDKLGDDYCWMCHRDQPHVTCATCPRSYHNHCFRRTAVSTDVEWVCPECVTILKAENQETRSKALKMVTLDQLCDLLMFAVQRMRSCSGSETFEGPVDAQMFPTYHDYIVYPMHLSLLERNIKKKCYGSTEAFVADASWLVHNSVVYNTSLSKLTAIAKNILKICKQEMAEIENCPDCYNYSYSADDSWFIQVCQKPHVLLWAKLKGFPYWPAKAMKCNGDSVDVRFFGAHDRAWVPVRDCYLYSQENPNPQAPSKPVLPQSLQRKRNPKNNLDVCIEEVELHIELLKQKFLEFQYAPLRTHIDPRKFDSHLLLLLPEYDMSKSNSSTPKKLPLQKERSFELKIKTSSAAGPSVKRMKADSSSPQPNTISIINVSPNTTPKKVDVSEATKSLTSDSGMPSPVISESKESGCSSDSIITTDFNSKSKDGLISIGKGKGLPSTSTDATPQAASSLCHSVQKPVKSSENASIAELRLKKKDARKIGLVDRIQEKISLWVTQGSNESKSDLSMENNEQPINEEDSKESQNSVDDLKSNKIQENAEKISDVAQPSNIETCSEVQANISEMCKEEDDEESSSSSGQYSGRDFFAGAKQLPRNSMSHLLQTFNINANQPKVVLKKLLLTPSLPNTSKEPQSESISIKSETNFSDDEEVTQPITEKAMKVTVTEMKMIPDYEGSESAEELESDSISVADTADSVSSTTPNSTSISPLTKISGREVSKQTESDEVKNSFSSVEPDPQLVTEHIIKAIERVVATSALHADTVSAETKDEKKLPDKIVNSKTSTSKGAIMTSKSASREIMERPSQRKTVSALEPILDPKAEPLSESDNEAEPKSSTICSENHLSSEATSEKEKYPNVLSKQWQCKDEESSGNSIASKVQPPQLKIVKSFAIRARPISDLKESSPRKFVPIAPKPDSENSPGNADTEPKGDSNVDQPSAVQYVSLRVGKPSNKEGVKSNAEPEKIILVSRSRESGAPSTHTVSLSTPNSKAKTIVVQAGKSRIASPPKTISTRLVTSPSQRLVHGATSILKIKNPSEGFTNVMTSSSDKVPTPQIRIIPARPESRSKKSSSPSTGSPTLSTQTPTFVTVSQSSNGRSIVKRILPSAISLAPVAKTVTASAGKQCNSVSQGSKISITSQNSTAECVSPPLIAALRMATKPVLTPTPDMVLKRIATETENSLKAPVSQITVRRISSGSPEVQLKLSVPNEMPQLSVASVSSLPTVNSIQTTAGANSPIQTSFVSKPFMSPSPQCTTFKSLPSKGPVSSELGFQAKKMTNVFMGCLKDCLAEMSTQGSLAAQVRCLQLDIEELQWRHHQEMEELRHNTELVVAEIRDRMKVETQHAVNIALASAKEEKEEAIAATKEKQWCAFCKKEAMFYCCWNTSYCDHRCQQDHWPVHSHVCTQNTSSLMDHNDQPNPGNGSSQR